MMSSVLPFSEASTCENDRTRWDSRKFSHRAAIIRRLAYWANAVAVGATLLLGSCSREMPTGLSANSLELVKVFSLTVREPSGLTYDPRTSSLYTISDGEGGMAYEISLQGAVIRTLPIVGNDMEGICLLGDSLYIAEERLCQIVIYALDGSRKGVIQVVVPGCGGNDGLEGVSWNAQTNSLYVAKQRLPALIVEMTRSGSETRRTEISTTSDLSDLCYDPDQKVLWAVNAQTSELLKFSTTGALLATWRTPVAKPEGIAIVGTTELYVVCDQDAKMYVFKKPS